MMTFTMSASTPTLDAKQKTIIVKPIMVNTIVGNVQTAYDAAITFEYTAIQNHSVLTFYKTEKTPTNTLAIINDVGWHSQMCFAFNVIYKEKLNTSYLFDHSVNISKLGIKRNWGNC